MQNLPLIDKSTEKQITELITKFVWNGRRPKIRNEVLSLEKSQGGRKLVNARIKDQAMKVDWVKRIYTSNDPVLAELAYYHINSKIRNGILWECNFASKDVELFNCRSQFWNDLLKIWAKYNFRTPQSVEEILNQTLWYNSHIKIEDKFLDMWKLYQHGIIYVKDLWFGPEMMKHHQFRQVHGNIISLLQYNALMDALPRQWRKIKVEQGEGARC